MRKAIGYPPTWIFPGLILLCAVVGRSEMVATIDDDVVTTFATYRPIRASSVRKARQFTIDPDFKNVSNIGDFTFSDAQKAKLLEHGFVAVHGDFPEMYDVYKNNEIHAIPSFVTVDAMLHVFHEQFDFILKTLEKYVFLDDLRALTDALLAASLDDYANASGDAARQAALRNAAYFAVAQGLLDETPTPTPTPLALFVPRAQTADLPTTAQTMVAAELALIEAHEGKNKSPIFVAKHDYSQFVPRGHYEGDDWLEPFFRSMMWYGLMRFSLDLVDPDLAITEADRRRMALQALLITRLMKRLELTDGTVREAWDRIYLPTVFFVGKADDIDLDTLDGVAREVYGARYADLTSDRLAEGALLDQFIARLDALPRPTIDDALSKSFRLMGQRYIPDSYMLDVFSETGRLPYGLDVMAVLGSERAEEILTDVYQDMPPYYQDVKNEFAAIPDAAWAQNLYWNWLYCLMPVLEIKGWGYPPFMQSDAWRDKDLAAALGSWTELRHDTILYAKQSGSEVSYDGSWLDQGYVEPNPEAFARLAALSQLANDGLDELGLLDLTFREYDDWGGSHEIAYSDNLQDLKNTLIVLQTIAEKELNNTPVTFDEYKTIERIGQRLSSLTDFGWGSGAASGLDDMALIADVHTHFDVCLEEAVGRPLTIHVIVDVAGDLRVTRGAAFSYFEFTQPISDRLTDSAWKEMLDAGEAPDMPVWMNSYFDAETAPNTSPRHSGEKDGVAGFVVECMPEPVQPGDPIQIRVKNIPFSYDPDPPFHEASFDGVRAVVTSSNHTTATLTLTEDPQMPGEYIGSVETAGWQCGLCYVEGQLMSEGKPVLSYHASVQIVKSNAGSSPAWRRYD